MRMPHAKTWQKLLTKSFDANTSIRVISQAHSLYEGYNDLIPMGVDSRSVNILRNRVYPGLAIYRSLLDAIGDTEVVLLEIESLFRVSFVHKTQIGLKFLNLLPDPFPVVRLFLRWVMNAQQGTYNQELVVDTRDTFAFNTRRCLIYDTLIAHDAGELTPLFCSTDDWLAEALPKVSWERTQTLGRGGDCCDFRWSRIR